MILNSDRLIHLRALLMFATYPRTRNKQRVQKEKYV